LISFLVVSRILLQALSWFVPHWSLYILYGIALVVISLKFSIFTALWNFWMVIVGASILQHFIVKRLKKHSS